MAEPILITGATGNVGRELVKILYAQKQPLRAAVVANEEAQRLPAAIPWRRFDFTDPTSYA